MDKANMILRRRRRSPDLSSSIGTPQFFSIRKAKGHFPLTALPAWSILRRTDQSMKNEFEYSKLNCKPNRGKKVGQLGGGKVEVCVLIGERLGR